MDIDKSDSIKITFENKNNINLKKSIRTDSKTILRQEKILFLAYDQGLEHGPADFNDVNVDPLFIVNIAQKGKYSGMVLQKGIAEKYRIEIQKSGVPLIIKLNGKTNLYQGEPISRQLCSVKEAKKFGASAVGYTIYLGSKFENVMMREFEKIEKKAHENNIPVILWAYPRGKSIVKRSKSELMIYAVRVGLELGADIVKIEYSGNAKDLPFAVKSAGRTKIVISGGMKKPEKEFLQDVKEFMKAGCAGIAVGRNIWQAKDPYALSDKLRKIIFS